MAVLMVALSLSWSSSHEPDFSALSPFLPTFFMCASRFTEPRLQTAISVSLVLSVISVQRFELCTVPTCDCGERTLHASLKVIQGCPVSNSIDSILRQRVSAGRRLWFLMRPSSARRSYSVYFFSNA